MWRYPIVYIRRVWVCTNRAYLKAFGKYMGFMAFLGVGIDAYLLLHESGIIRSSEMI